MTGVLALSWLLAIVDAVTVPSATSPLTSAALLLLALGWLRRAAEGGAVLGPLALETAPARSMRRVLAWLVGIVALLLVLVRLGPADVPWPIRSVRSAVTTTAVIGAMLVVMARVTRHLDRADRDVRVSEERLRALVDAIAEVVWSTDARGRVDRTPDRVRGVHRPTVVGAPAARLDRRPASRRPRRRTRRLAGGRGPAGPVRGRRPTVERLDRPPPGRSCSARSPSGAMAT